QQGRELSLDELCREHPECRDEVARRLAVLRPGEQALGMQATLEAPADATLAGSVPAPPPPDVPGYVILGELGRGGMGVVYKARQLDLDRIVALKMILAGGEGSTAELARFRTEAQALARLQHPNIVQVFEVGQRSPGTPCPWIAMEYCAGGSLEKKLG